MSEWFVVIEIAEMHTITWVSLLYGKNGREQKVRCRDSDDTDKEKETCKFHREKKRLHQLGFASLLSSGIFYHAWAFILLNDIFILFPETCPVRSLTSMLGLLHFPLVTM